MSLDQSKDLSPSLHLRKLKELIKEYAEQGYTIFADFRDYTRPKKIGKYQPDLIVKRGNKEIVIEILSKNQMKELKPKLEQFAKYADKTRDVRFDLVLTNPRPHFRKSDKGIKQRELLKDVQRSLMVDANVAYNRRQYQATFYLLYDVLKSLLEEYAASNNVPLGDKRTLRSISDRLMRHGLVNEEDHQILNDLILMRRRMVNQIGEGEFIIHRSHLDGARELARVLLKNLS